MVKREAAIRVGEGKEMGEKGRKKEREYELRAM